MRFGDLQILTYIGWIIPGMIVLYIFANRSRKRALRRFADEGTLPEISASFNLRRKKMGNILMSAAVCLMVIALMRPQVGFKWREVKKKGIDILIALDTSNSMLAEDVLPNRLQRAKLAIKDLVRKLHGDRVGLIVFSGTAFLQCPLTIDYNGFLLSLDDVDANIIPVGGTSIARAIYTAMNSYEEGKKENKVLIIITDGEDLEGGVDQAIAMAKHEGVTIYCVGIGDPEGELIPVTDERGKKVFLKDAEGNVVKTRLTEDVLQKIAIDTGGMYVRATGAEFGLDLIYDERLSKLEKEEIKSRMEKQYNERFQVPLAFALVLLFIQPFVGDRKREKSSGVRRKGTGDRG